MVDLNCITLPCQPSPPAPQSSDAMSDYSFSYMLRARDLNFVYVSESVTEVLGFEIHDLVNRDLSMDILFHEQEKEHAVRTLNETARNDKVACLVYLQLYHNTRGFVDCVMTQSAVNDGSVSWFENRM
ncbi:hypothetical protein FRC12_022102 [Ceratobasidium sp. 428]|nr:hypothetical protein FRC12_022102 [Ceratobasidium sp. 428]